MTKTATVEAEMTKQVFDQLTADKIHNYLTRTYPDHNIEYFRYSGVILDHTEGKAVIPPTIEEMEDIEFWKTEEDMTESDRILIKIWEEEHQNEAL